MKVKCKDGIARNRRRASQIFIQDFSTLFLVSCESPYVRWNHPMSDGITLCQMESPYVG